MISLRKKRIKLQCASCGKHFVVKVRGKKRPVCPGCGAFNWIEFKGGDKEKCVVDKQIFTVCKSCRSHLVFKGEIPDVCPNCGSRDGFLLSSPDGWIVGDDVEILPRDSPKWLEDIRERMTGEGMPERWHSVGSRRPRKTIPREKRIIRKR